METNCLFIEIDGMSRKEKVYMQTISNQRMVIICGLPRTGKILFNGL
jgi:hypothetical protein